MNSVKLAQFYSASNEQTKLELLEGIDISYCIPDENPEALQTKLHGGYNCLHLTIERSFLNVINVLLDRGVDFLKQGTYDGITPLHKAFYKSRYTPNCIGKLEENEIVNILLSAQVSRNNPFNPKCSKGLTHLHIACAVNHTEAVALFVKTKESLNERTNSDECYHLSPGYTALHYAIKHSSIESAEILLKNGVDIHSKDSITRSGNPLDFLIHRLLDVKEFMCMGKRAISWPYQKEIERLESIAKTFLETRPPGHTNFMSNTGLSTFHLACVLTDPSIGAEFLKQNIDVNATIKDDCQSWPGWTPLHFAACSSVEMFKLLLQNGGNISIKNAKGETPLDLLIMRYDPEIVCSVLSLNNDIKNILMSDGATKMLDLLSAMNNCETFNNFLQGLENVNISVPLDSPVWPGYSILHLVIIQNEKTKTQEEFLQKLNIKEDCSSLPEVYNCTEEDEKKYWKRIIMCSDRSCSISIKNADGLSPIHFAFSLFKLKVIDFLLNNCQDNLVDSNNLSVLHIACAIGRTDVVKRLLNNGADINIRTKSKFQWFGKPFQLIEEAKPYLIPVRVNSTPLHVAVIFENKSIIKYLLQKNADVYVKDELGLTPIHLTMAAFRKRDAPQIIKDLVLRQIANLQESVSNHGLTHLHVAAYADDEHSIERLIQQGANVNAIFQATIPKCSYDEHPPCELSFLAHYVGMTPLRLAALGGQRDEAVRLLIRHGADIFAQNAKGETILNSIMDWFDYPFVKHIVEKLKRDRKFVEPINPNGLTLLHVACATLDLNWTKKLLLRGANVNAQINGDSEYRNGDTPLKMLIAEATLPDDIPRNLESFVKLLLKHGADVTITCESWSPLHVAHRAAYPDSLWDDEEEEVDEERAATMLSIADSLLRSQKSYAINPTDTHGYSHFHYACSRNKVNVVRKFLDNGIDINLRKDPFAPENAGWTPLHYAFKFKSEAVARLLIERGADVKAENSHGETPLHVALQNDIVDLQMFQTMLSKGADINAKTIHGNQRPIDYFLNISNITYKQLKFFLANGSTIDVLNNKSNNTTFGLAMKNADPRDRQSIFKKLMKIGNLKNAIENGFNAIENIVAVHQEGQLTLNYYLETIQMFMEMGCKIDQQNEKGETALHKAVIYYNMEAIEALLLLGVNINVVNNKNETPFTIHVFHVFNIDDEREARSMEILATHVWKMKLVGLKVHESCEEAMNSTHEEFPLSSDLQRRCENELDSLKQKNIGESMTMFDFLSDSRTVKSYPTMPFAQRQIVDEFFSDNLNCQLQFPELAGLLASQYKIARQRDTLYEPAKVALAAICNVQLPDLCSENVLFNFENEELREMINLAQQI